MEQQLGFVAQWESRKFGKFSEVVIEYGQKRSAYDHSVFFKQSTAGCILFVVYVDDIVITDSDSSDINMLKAFLGTRFQTKELGPLKYFLGKYAQDLLDETDLAEAKPGDAPMIPNVKLGAEDENVFVDADKYRSVLGKLNYLTITQPDIAFPISIVSHFMLSPRTSHWDVVTHILRYLKGSPGRRILYKDRGHCRVEGFSNTDWTGSLVDRCSTTGYYVFVGGNLVSWKSKKQSVVARSSAESEYWAMAQIFTLPLIQYFMREQSI
ncbi:uncharacterized protein LOC111406703 [Olea europaea var. sylvestris]|uniref:uncharacterized protein LOC111406703 n=1 Tax=Olea europaea var. sylvestris TaxID=158386 RepID=UPI000C1D6B49|nr:uncharacterized protein LOC111406703 [Olea europaea var. sylvestris]